MSIWAIVPVKSFKRAKTRLAPVLSPEERQTISRNFLTHTLEVLNQVPEIQRTLVISRDPAVLRLARKHQAYTVTESERTELNAALTRATDVAAQLGAHAVLVMPSDMPLLDPDDIRKLIAASDEPECVTIAPDWRDYGTNALFMRPPRIIPYVFGPDSFEQHKALARDRGARVEICRFPGLGLDIDVPEDLAKYRKQLKQAERRAG
ncbi:MAG: 2-phospho-L-lactate guanylyltransferase [Chloroflexi bacterium]|nr:2-phospho-L-lactate guanylyltransferase [Chloroflexota bacterium]